MAAGLGTRLRPFTHHMPKPLLPLMGVPMAQFAFDSLVGVGVTNLVANIHAHPEISRRLLGGLDLGGAKLTLSDESQGLLGSGGGIRTALPMLGNRPFYLLNADTICSVELEGLKERHLKLRRDRGVNLTLTLFRAGPRAGKYSEIFFDEKAGLIKSLGGPVTAKPFFVGVAIIEPDALSHLPQNQAFEFVPEILKPAIAAEKAGFYLADGLWFDVGSPQLWHEAHMELIAAGERDAIPSRWRKRIEIVAERVSANVWGDRDKNGEFELGPKSVIYGPRPDSASSTIISYDGIAVDVT